QPLGRDVAGTRETVGAIRRDDLLGFMAAHYVPRAMVVSVAGQVEQEQVVPLVAAAFAALDGSIAPPVAAPAGSDQTAPRVNIFAKETEQTNLCLGLPALSYTDPDR